MKGTTKTAYWRIVGVRGPCSHETDQRWRFWVDDGSADGAVRPLHAETSSRAPDEEVWTVLTVTGSASRSRDSGGIYLWNAIHDVIGKYVTGADRGDHVQLTMLHPRRGHQPAPESAGTLDGDPDDPRHHPHFVIAPGEQLWHVVGVLAITGPGELTTIKSWVHTEDGDGALGDLRYDPDDPALVRDFKARLAHVDQGHVAEHFLCGVYDQCDLAAMGFDTFYFCERRGDEVVPL